MFTILQILWILGIYYVQLSNGQAFKEKSSIENIGKRSVPTRDKTITTKLSKHYFDRKKNNEIVEKVSEKPTELSDVPSCIRVYVNDEYRTNCNSIPNKHDPIFVIVKEHKIKIRAILASSQFMYKKIGNIYFKPLNGSYLKLSKNGEFEKIGEAKLERIGNVPNWLYINQSEIIEFSYHCDNCIQNGLTVKIILVVGTKDFIEKIYNSRPPIKYVKDELNYNANCSLHFDGLEIQSVSFNDKKKKVKDIVNVKGKELEEFINANSFIIYTDKNPSGKITCNYQYEDEIVSLSTSYEIIKNGQNSSNKSGTLFNFIFIIIFIIKMVI